MPGEVFKAVLRCCLPHTMDDAEYCRRKLNEIRHQPTRRGRIRSRFQ